MRNRAFCGSSSSRRCGATSHEELEVAQTTVTTAEADLRAAQSTVVRTERELQAARARMALPARWTNCRVEEQRVNVIIDVVDASRSVS